jgi:hypothetical protein
MLRVPCNTRSQIDSQHGEVTPRTKVSEVDWHLGNQSRVKPIYLRVGYLSLYFLPKILLHIHEWNTWMMGFWLVFLCWWAPSVITLQKPSNVLSCTYTCSGAPFWTHRDPLVQLPPNGMRNSTLLHQGFAPWSWEFPRRIPCGCLPTLHWKIAPNLNVPYENPILGELDRRSRRVPQASSQGEWASSPPPPSWW